jgi:hypothetical protein
MALPSFFEDRKRALGEGDPVYRQVDYNDIQSTSKFKRNSPFS